MKTFNSWFAFWVFLSVFFGGMFFFYANKPHTVTPEEVCAKNNGVPIYDQGFFASHTMIDCKLYKIKLSQEERK